jgi:periplasmic divalent cation tolerance protein
VHEPVVVLVTAASRDEAERIGDALVEAMVAACATIVPGVTSIYRWEGRMERAEEWLLIIKTRSDVLGELIERVHALHSYEVPEVLALPVVGGSEAYLRWLDGAVHGSWHAVD